VGHTERGTHPSMSQHQGMVGMGTSENPSSGHGSYNIRQDDVQKADMQDLHLAGSHASGSTSV
jgi:hypothetical protein